jgi:hypothetical protein
MQTVILSIVSAISLLWLIGCYVRRRIDRQVHELRMKQERNKQVFYFRERLRYKFGEGAYMPDYQAMLNSDKPLVAKEWINVDELINLN